MDRRADKRRLDKPRLPGARFMSFGPFGPLGALGERMGQGHPLDGFDPEAFQNGAYGNAESADRDSADRRS
jgi:hypothetical protein